MKNKTVMGNKIGRKESREIGCFSWQVDKAVTIVIHKPTALSALSIHPQFGQASPFRPASQRRAVLELSLLR